MEKPNPSRQARTNLSITSVLKVMSDDKSLVLFNNAIVSNNNRIISLKKINLSSKKYHDRLSSLLKTGLIKRHEGKYIPTSLGRVVYNSLMVIEEALSNYWKLEVIDQIEMSHFDVPTEEVVTRLIKTLIDNHRISSILLLNL
jgi:hypothetical protein